MELYWYIVVILFIIIKIFFYVCWYRSRRRQLTAFLSNPRNTQIVIVGGRAYLQQVCERENASVRPIWRANQDDGSPSAPPAPAPTAPSYAQFDAPPPYEAISGNELKPPPYSECMLGGASVGSWPDQAAATPNPGRITGAPPPYIPYPCAGEGPSGTGPGS
ncbi:uncharacterized protein LOC118771397 isoform X2 [Megalops cyprinoides]|uniref:uncharacterized protein LOC118771397 isoform X2 n=1 Tax=Megalops cyprinoides TaxID=118141 RepID=UPI0018654BB7|nr:uncharacterized protein LOC118771397 isoform X2 [Megalops cyprinoides]